MKPALSKYNILAHVEIRGALLAVCGTPMAERPYEARDRNGSLVYPGYLRNSDGKQSAVFLSNGQVIAEFQLPGWTAINSGASLPPPSVPATEAAQIAGCAASPVIVRQMLAPFAPLQSLTQEEAFELIKEEESFFHQPEFTEAAVKVWKRQGVLETFMARYWMDGARKAVA